MTMNEEHVRALYRYEQKRLGHFAVAGRPASRLRAGTLRVGSQQLPARGNRRREVGTRFDTRHWITPGA